MRKQKTASEFVICVKTDDPDLITPRMIYRVLPDASAARSEFVRVVDNEGEDYLYPADYFLPFAFPQAIKQALQRLSQNASIGRKRRTVFALRRKTKPNAA